MNRLKPHIEDQILRRQGAKFKRHFKFAPGICAVLNYAYFSVDKKNQLDVTFCILYFSSNSCSTCFGSPCAHHQELTTA